MTDHPPPSHGPDTAPAYRGLIIGAIALLIILFAIVKLTDAHYAHLAAVEAAQTH